MTGELSNLNDASLPLVGALGGMIVPALIYVLVISLNGPNAHDLAGWAIPAATDIAFALGLLGLIAARAPASAKAFLLALAIFDDIGAIIIIALFYTSKISLWSLVVAIVACGMAFLINRFGIRRPTPYMLLGLLLWVGMLKSGVHATLSGVLIALAIPHERNDGFLERLEHDLKPWISYFIMPIFAFANAGVSLAGFGVATLVQPISLGITLGLFVGKPLGILGFLWIAVKARLVKLPSDLSWPMLTVLALLAGIGFTMSLFIGSLAFQADYSTASVRIGVLTGSLLAGLSAWAVASLVNRQSVRPGVSD